MDVREWDGVGGDCVAEVVGGWESDDAAVAVVEVVCESAPNDNDFERDWDSVCGGVAVANREALCVGTAVGVGEGECVSEADNEGALVVEGGGECVAVGRELVMVGTVTVFEGVRVAESSSLDCVTVDERLGVGMVVDADCVAVHDTFSTLPPSKELVEINVECSVCCDTISVVATLPQCSI